MSVIWRTVFDGAKISINRSKFGFYIDSHPRIPNELPKEWEAIRAVLRLLNSRAYDGIDPAEFCKEVLGRSL